MKYTFIIWLVPYMFIAALLVMAWNYIDYGDSMSLLGAPSNTCEDGFYSIGNGICKAEPTGCVNGDSIPLDSPKCENSTLPKVKQIIEIDNRIWPGK